MLRPMSQRLGWGILGTGAIARAFAAALPQSTTGRLVAVASRSPTTAEQFGAEFNVVRCHGRYDALLADDAVQAVYISTPHPQHAAWAICAAAAGKHVLCEKPLTINHAEAMAVVEAAHRYHVFLMEAFMYRCHPQTAKLVDLIRAGAIGDVRVIQASFSFHCDFNPASRIYDNNLAGGGILDVGCYPVSLARLVAGAAVGRDFADPLAVVGAGHLGRTGVDEWAAAILRFPDDIIAQVASGVAVNQDNVARLYGTKGHIVIPNPWQANREHPTPGTLLVHRAGRSAPDEILVPTDRNSFTHEADVVGCAVAAGRLQAPAMTWADSLGNSQTLDRWRDAVGLVYEQEKPTASRPVWTLGRSGPMPTGVIAGIRHPVARLVMGVDNQLTFPHAGVMFDDYFARGGNCFDTAFHYPPVVEQNLGNWIRQRGVRDQVVLIGKGAHTPFCNPADLTRQLQRSLDRLQTDHVDLYLMHRDNPEIPVGEFVDVLNHHLRAGRLRAFGGSNWTTDRVAAANDYARRNGLTGFAAVSNNFSLARMVHPVWPGCLAASDPVSRAWLTQHRLPLLAWSSQARGFFTDRAHPDRRDDTELVRCWYSADNFERRARAVELAQRRGVLPINIALAYVLCQPFPTFALIGPRTLAETRTTWPALTVALTPAELRWLNLEA